MTLIWILIGCYLVFTGHGFMFILLPQLILKFGGLLNLILFVAKVIGFVTLGMVVTFIGTKWLELE